MFRRFSIWLFDKPSSSPASYAEALLAGWVPPLPETYARIAPVRQALEENSDGAAFLARVYVNQRC